MRKVSCELSGIPAVPRPARAFFRRGRLLRWFSRSCREWPGDS